MPKLILIRTAQTDWQAQGRLAGDTDLDLNEIGRRQAAADAQAITGFSPHSLHCGPDQATRQTAGVIGTELRLKAHAIPALREMDLGHWEGLTVDALRERFGKVYRKWRSEPETVQPPEGESVSEMAARIDQSLRKILKKNADKPIAMVLGPFAYATARCKLDDGNYDQFWTYVEKDETWRAFDLKAESEQAAASEKTGDQ